MEDKTRTIAIERPVGHGAGSRRYGSVGAQKITRVTDSMAKT